MQTNQCTASIAVKGNKIKNYNGSFYLKGGQEFEIDLQNFTKDVVAAKLFMNGKAISESMLVLKPGQKVLLTRYLDEAKKFLFETYKVDGSPETQKAIEDNGNVEVRFYKEKFIPPVTYSTTTIDWTNNYPIDRFYNSSGTSNINNQFSSLTGNISSYVGGQSINSLRKIKGFDEVPDEKFRETGRVEKGSHSNQEFKNFVGNFEAYAFQTIKLKLLPYQYKPLTMNDLAEYCIECGTKNRKGNYKFCPKCGNKY